MDTSKLDPDYYRINGTKKVLYWDGSKWMKPAKDTRGSYGGWLAPLEKQPKIKTAEKVNINEIH